MSCLLLHDMKGCTIVVVIGRCAIDFICACSSCFMTLCCVAASGDEAEHVDDSTDSLSADVLQSAQSSDSHQHLSPESAAAKTADASKKGH